ncbi:uncharacterized protein EAE97_005429 [Botrytis byssoidea]|uniref:2EXR domain-containing protein n=1 Tax=Botrytis byssoidea TaxID=139641 RepID=A0A9P5IQ61_9HELO|nr:uncharacterized protein EAE97_005429 [Botrytis byssoidea]KAF7944796.1 hypothetical protein EAE97_005429 [Botrytis byssoidea]
MLRFITEFQRKRLERISTAVTDHAIVHGHQQASTGTEKPHRNRLFFYKIKAVSKHLFSKVSSSSLNHEFATNTTNAGESKGNGKVLHDGEPWDEEEEERTFNRFQDLPIELRLDILELYLEEPRITTLNFVSSDLLHHDHMYGKRFRLTCGSLPPILCLNHEYRNIFLDRFTKPGMTRSRTTLSIEDALKIIANEERNTALRDSFTDGSPSAFPIYSTRTYRNIIYNPEDIIWIQGDFWLDELRRSALARSAFHNLKYLAIPYRTRRKSLFDLEDMLSFLSCIISTFANIQGIMLVLEVEDVVPERPIYNGEIHFYAPEKIRMVSSVPHDVSVKSRKSLSRYWRKVLGKPVASPEVELHTEYWSARRLASDAWLILDFIKSRAIEAGNRGFSVSPWKDPSEVERWEIPFIQVVTAGLSTSRGERDIIPTIRIEDWIEE